jgi:hypothetical protein
MGGRMSRENLDLALLIHEVFNSVVREHRHLIYRATSTARQARTIPRQYGSPGPRPKTRPSPKIQK